MKCPRLCFYWLWSRVERCLLLWPRSCQLFALWQMAHKIAKWKLMSMSNIERHYSSLSRFRMLSGTFPKWHSWYHFLCNRLGSHQRIVARKDLGSKVSSRDSHSRHRNQRIFENRARCLGVVFYRCQFEFRTWRWLWVWRCYEQLRLQWWFRLRRLNQRWQ